MNWRVGEVGGDRKAEEPWTEPKYESAVPSPECERMV